MMRRHPRTVACLAGVVLAVVQGLQFRPGAAGQSRADPAESPAEPGVARPLVRLEVLGTPPGGATGTFRAKAQTRLGAGERTTWFIGADNGLTGNLCNSGISREEPSDAAVRWRVDAEVLDATESRATIAVVVARSRRLGTDFASDTSVSRTVRLDLGENQVLDYLADPASRACASVLVQLGASTPPVAERPTPLVFDLWLEYKGRLGRRWEHRQVNALSGVQTPFRFEGMRWAVDEAAARDGVGPVALDVAGSVLGVARPDGSVDIALRSERRLSWMGFGLSGEGQADYRANLGEAAELVLPEPANPIRASLPPSVKIASPGLVQRGAEGLLDVARFLGGSVAIHVRVQQPGPGER